MKKYILQTLLLSSCLLAFGFSRAADEWPKIINTSNGTQIKVYEPEPESFKGNTLMFRSAISILATVVMILFLVHSGQLPK